MDTESKTNETENADNVENADKVDISKLIENVESGKDSSCKPKLPSEWVSRYCKILAAIVDGSIDKDRAVDARFESLQKERKPIFDKENGATIDEEYKRLSEEAHEAFVKLVEENKEWAKPSDKMIELLDRNEGRFFMDNLLYYGECDDVILFTDGYGRGHQDVYDSDDEFDEEAEKERSENEDLYVRVIGNVTESDLEVIKKLNDAACFLNRNGYWMKPKQRVCLVMRTFCSMYKSGVRWGFFIPACVISC